MLCLPCYSGKIWLHLGCEAMITCSPMLNFWTNKLEGHCLQPWLSFAAFAFLPSLNCLWHSIMVESMTWQVVLSCWPSLYLFPAAFQKLDWLGQQTGSWKEMLQSQPPSARVSVKFAHGLAQCQPCHMYITVQYKVALLSHSRSHAVCMHMRTSSWYSITHAHASDPVLSNVCHNVPFTGQLEGSSWLHRQQLQRRPLSETARLTPIRWEKHSDFETN